MAYEVTNNYCSGVFIKEDDAIMAMYMLGRYHKMNLQPSEIRTKLREEGSYERYPLIIRNCDG